LGTGLPRPSRWGRAGAGGAGVGGGWGVGGGGECLERTRVKNTKKRNNPPPPPPPPLFVFFLCGLDHGGVAWVMDASVATGEAFSSLRDYDAWLRLRWTSLRQPVLSRRRLTSTPAHGVVLFFRLLVRTIVSP